MLVLLCKVVDGTYVFSFLGVYIRTNLELFNGIFEFFVLAFKCQAFLSALFIGFCQGQGFYFDLVDFRVWISSRCIWFSSRKRKTSALSSLTVLGISASASAGT